MLVYRLPAFSGVWTWNEIGYAKQIEEGFVGEPFAAADELVAKHADTRGRSTEGSKAKFEERCEYFQDWVH